MTGRAGLALAALAVGGCAQEPAPPPFPDRMAALADSSAVVLRTAGEPRNVVYVYRLAGDLGRRGWRADLVPVGGRWLWFRCGPYGRRAAIYPC